MHDRGVPWWYGAQWISFSINCTFRVFFHRITGAVGFDHNACMYLRALFQPDEAPVPLSRE